MPGLLYLKCPASISVALGRFSYDSGWIPMRLDRSAGTYARFGAPRP